MRFKKLIEDYYSSYEYKNLRSDTKKYYAYLLEIIGNTEVGGKTLYQYTLDHIGTKNAKHAYDIWCERGLSLANHAMSIARIVMNHGLRMEHCTTNPFAHVRKRKTDARKVVWTREDVQKLLDVAYSDYSTRNLGLIAHMAYAWCQRLGDMRLLTWDAIDFDRQTVYIKQSKRKAEVFLPIEDDLFDMLKQQHEDFGFQPYVAPRPQPIRGEYCPYTIYKLPLHGRKLMDAAGLPKELRLSDLRRTGTTEMVDAGVGIAQIMAVTGHANPQSVKPYMKHTLKSADYALTERNNHAKSISTAAKETDTC